MNFKIIQALVVTAFLGLASQASAMPTHSLRLHYYSDSSFTHQIGSQIELTCFNGHGALMGQSSENIVEEWEPCQSFFQYEVDCMVDGVMTTCPYNICDTYGVCS